MYCKIISIKEMILFLGDNRVITSPPDNARADSLYSTIISLFASQGISSRSVRTNEELDIQTMFSDKTVFLVGHSLGAFRLSQIYARLNNSNVQHLILFDPLIDIYKKEKLLEATTTVFFNDRFPHQDWVDFGNIHRLTDNHYFTNSFQYITDVLLDLINHT